MRVLITGGAGFVGANLCKELLANSRIDEVRVIDDFSTGFRSNVEALSISLIEGSILDEVALARAAEGCDAIVHLAAVGSVPRSIADPMRSHHVNTTGTLNVLEAARANDAHVVLASSSSVYGANPVLPKTEDLQCRPVSPYAVSKLATEQYAMAYAACYGLRVLPFRFFNIFGPLQAAGHDYAAVVPAFVDAALNDRPLPVNGDGTQSRDFTYVGTVVEVLTAAVIGRIAGDPTNLAFGTRTTLNEVIEILSGIFDRDLPVTYRPPRLGDVPHSQASETNVRQMFPTVRPVGLKEGLEATVAWMSEILDPS